MWPSPSTVGTAIQSSPLLRLQEAFLGCIHPPSLSSASGFLEQVGSEPRYSCGDFCRSVLKFSIRRSLLSQGPRSPEVQRGGKSCSLLAPGAPGWCKRGRAYATEDGLQAEHRGPGPFSAMIPGPIVSLSEPQVLKLQKWEQMSWAR